MDWAGAVRGAVRSVDSNVLVAEVETLTEVVSLASSQTRFSLVLLGAFAGLPLILAAVGLFWLLPRRLGRRVLPAAWAVAVLALLAVQLEWAPILSMYAGTSQTWSDAVAAGRQLGAIHAQPEFRDANIAMRGFARRKAP